MAKSITKTTPTPVDPPRIRVRDLSWPLRVMVTLSAVAGALIITYFTLVIIAYLAYAF